MFINAHLSDASGTVVSFIALQDTQLTSLPTICIRCSCAAPVGEFEQPFRPLRYVRSKICSRMLAVIQCSATRTEEHVSSIPFQVQKFLVAPVNTSYKERTCNAPVREILAIVTLLYHAFANLTLGSCYFWLVFCCTGDGCALQEI